MNAIIDLANENSLTIDAQAQTIKQPNGAPPVVLVILNLKGKNGRVQVLMPEPYARGILTTLTQLTSKNIMVTDAQNRESDKDGNQSAS